MDMDFIARRLLSTMAASMCCSTLIHAATFVDRRVIDILDEQRGSGFVFIYSSHTLTPQLRVLSEPKATSGLDVAREILAQHGLTLVEAAPKIYTVTRGVKTIESNRSVETARPAPQYPIEHIVVQTSRYKLDSAYAASVNFLSQDQLKDLPQLADETLRAVQRLPGSATNGYSSVGPVRGGEPREIAIILDGLRLYEPFHLKDFLNPVSLLDSRLIEGLEFYSGGFPAIYGDRMSAIIDARSIRPGQPRYYEAGLNLFHASALGSLEFDGERGRALASYRRSNLGDLVQFSEKDFGEPNYQDGFVRVDYSFSDSTQGAWHVLVSSDSIDALRANETQRAHAEYRNVYVWGTLEHDWSDAASSRVIFSYTDLVNERRGNIDEPARTASVVDDRVFHVLGLRWENTLDSERIRQRFGIEERHLWGSYDYASDVRWAAGEPFPGSPPSQLQRRLQPAPDGYESLAYWDARFALGKRWIFHGGLRVDTQTYDGSDDGEQWSPRFSVLYALSPSSQLRASWGNFYQAQGINELQVEDGVDRFYPAQFTEHFILGFDHAFEAGVDLRIEAYSKRYRHLHPRFENLFDPLTLFPEAEVDRVRFDPSGARAIGLETLLRLQPRGSWSGWLSYAWAQVEDRIDGEDVPRSWDQRHAVNLGIVWSKGPWTVSLANSYHSGWPTTKLTFDPSSRTPQVSNEGRNRSRFAAFNSLDLRVTRVFALQRGVLDVFAEVTNATSRENPCCVEYNRVIDASGAITYEADIDSWLPLVPNVGVLWRY